MDQQREVGEQIGFGLIEIKARFALHAFAQAIRDGREQFGVGVDRHQMNADVALSVTHAAEEHGALHLPE